MLWYLPKLRCFFNHEREDYYLDPILDEYLIERLSKEFLFLIILFKLFCLNNLRID